MPDTNATLFARHFQPETTIPASEFMEVELEMDGMLQNHFPLSKKPFNLCTFPPFLMCVLLTEVIYLKGRPLFLQPPHGLCGPGSEIEFDGLLTPA